MILGPPEYIRLQCKKVTLNQCLKILPAIAQFSHSGQEHRHAAVQASEQVPLRVKAGEQGLSRGYPPTADKEKDTKVCSCPLTPICVVS